MLQTVKCLYMYHILYSRSYRLWPNFIHESYFIFQMLQAVTKFFTCIIFYFPIATGCNKSLNMYHILFSRCYRLWQNFIHVSFYFPVATGCNKILYMYHISYSRCYRLWQIIVTVVRDNCLWWPSSCYSPGR